MVKDRRRLLFTCCIRHRVKSNSWNVHDWYRGYSHHRIMNIFMTGARTVYSM